MKQSFPGEYRPFQSMSEAVRKRGGIRCEQYSPSEQLQPYISCYWTMASTIELEKPILHRIIPDGCIDVIFDLSERSRAKAASVAGTMTKPLLAEMRGRVCYLAVRFQPGGFLYFFDTPAHYLTDKVLPLETISASREHELIERLIEVDDIGDRIELLEQHFSNLLTRNDRDDPTVRITLSDILRHKGDIGISQLSKGAGSSQRQLRRKFERWIGVSPKSFCRIIRFQSTLRMLPSRSRCNLLSVALDAGYYDQSHFIHEFKSYSGLNPSDFVANKNL